MRMEGGEQVRVEWVEPGGMHVEVVLAFELHESLYPVEEEPSICVQQWRREVKMYISSRFVTGSLGIFDGSNSMSLLLSSEL